MATSSEEIWNRLKGKLPEVGTEEQTLAMEKWLLAKTRYDQLSPQEEATAAMHSIFNDGFHSEMQQAIPATETIVKRVSLVQWSKWAGAIAAMLLLAFGLLWSMDEGNAYATAMASAAETTTEVAYLGATHEAYVSLCDLQTQLPLLANGKQGIAIPEQVAIVQRVGISHGITFFDIQQDGCEIRVITNKTAPEVGEMLSFNAQAVSTSHFGREIVLLLETVRHEVY